MLKINDAEMSARHLNEKTFVIMMSVAKLFLRSEAIPSFEHGIWQKRFVFYSHAFGCNRIQKHGTFLIGARACRIERADGLERSPMSRRQIMRRLGILGFDPAIGEKERVINHGGRQSGNGAVEAEIVLGVMINKAASGPPKRLVIYSKAFQSGRMNELGSTWPIREQPYDYFFWQNGDLAGADMESRKEVKWTLERFGFNPNVVDIVFPTQTCRS